MNETSMPAERGVSNRVVFKCDLTAARTATRILRDFLGEQGLDPSELFHCEVCLAEACNNAVQYAADTPEPAPIVAEAVFHGTGVEMRVMDHTRGFELRERPASIDPRQETGRGLFIIQSLMDDVRYYRGAGRNTLVMRKSRTHQNHRPEHDVAVTTLEDARRQLQSCQDSISGMARELCLRSETLAAIFRCSAELGRTNDLEGFGLRLLSDLMHLTSADWFLLRLVAPVGSRLEVFAASEPTLRGAPLLLAPALDSAVPLELAAALSRRIVEFEPGGVASPADPLHAAGKSSCGLVLPMLFGEKLVGTLGIGRHGPMCFTALEVETIRTFAEFMAVQVINARRVEEEVHARIVAHELDIAHRIQRALLPRQLPTLPGFTLAANWESARQVGGDFYDVLPLDEHSVLLVVADVMGKGVPAAMFATIMRSLLRALISRRRRPAHMLNRLNELLYDELSSVGMFITVQLVLVDTAERTVVAASAGHCPVIVASRESAQPLRVAGTPLGILPHANYKEQSWPLLSPAALLLYTDGITEALNPNGQMYGIERLLTALRLHFDSAADASQLRDSLAADVQQFSQGEPLRDDQAFVVLLESTSPAFRSATRTTGDFLEANATAPRHEFTFPSPPPVSLPQ